MTDTDIKNEIMQIIDGDSGRIPADKIVKSVLNIHGPAQGENADFYDNCASHHVRYVVRQTLQRMRCEETEESSGQMFLDGFERVQQRYIIEQEDGELVAVPVTDMTDAEIRTKIQDLYRTARGCVEHAEELERYLSKRAPKLVAV